MALIFKSFSVRAFKRINIHQTTPGHSKRKQYRIRIESRAPLELIALNMIIMHLKRD